VKWGGELTKLGEAQAISLGQRFRDTMYPGEVDGVLRLHSTLRHDLKIYTSDEGRVQMTAAAFAKGFLDLEGMLTPILASLVSKNREVTAMLDDTPELGRHGMDESKRIIHELLTRDQLSAAGNSGSEMMRASLSGLTEPKRMLHRLHSLVNDLVMELCELKEKGDRSDETEKSRKGSNDITPTLSSTGDALHLDDDTEGPYDSDDTSVRMSKLDLATEGERQPANGETAHLHFVRWAKLSKDFFKPKKARFDTTKIPDLYDNAVYDMLHNQHLGLRTLPELYVTARALASFVVPQEYGIDPRHKLAIGKCIASSLLAKVRRDLLAATSADSHELERVHVPNHSFGTDVRTPKRHVRTRLYFTSESHMYSVFNVLRWGHQGSEGHDDKREPNGRRCGGIFSDVGRAKYDEMEPCYLTHIVFRLFHKRSRESASPSSYMVQLLVSPGVSHHDAVTEEVERGQWQWHRGRAGRLSTSNVIRDADTMQVYSQDGLTLEDVDQFLGRLLPATSDESESTSPTNMTLESRKY